MVGSPRRYIKVCSTKCVTNFEISQTSNNLSCYQCIRNTNTPCEPHELQPCPPVSDRCVTHISKNAEDGFSIKRECGLGPCGFDDDMVNKGLGFDCDRSRAEYFCIFCCRDSGCNNSESVFAASSSTALLVTTLVVTLYWRNKFFA
ncbi:uncharacterized protein LOC135141077 isoform X2 [Zophobas morio]|uniref:uncharacterized protein LOC135141077 isoform X2 n=1 Tax=Zophobas morio TaxID=2755281 RepID=UPI0030836416